jgi:hypothetical protein
MSASSPPPRRPPLVVVARTDTPRRSPLLTVDPTGPGLTLRRVVRPRPQAVPDAPRRRPDRDS